MRGRTFNDSFIILDEAQNTTPEQMKMFLTRLGFNSKMVITGDVTQVDLPHGYSGLKGVRRILEGVEDIAFRDLTGARRGAAQPRRTNRRSLRKGRRNSLALLALALSTESRRLASHRLAARQFVESRYLSSHEQPTGLFGSCGWLSPNRRAASEVSLEPSWIGSRIFLFLPSRRIFVLGTPGATFPHEPKAT